VEDYISAGEAVDMISKELRPISLSKMTRLMTKGEIPAIRDPLDERRKLVKRADVLRWIEAHRIKNEGRAALAFC
jgi:hypothetical protein